jgi:hypothetical protein
MLPLSAQPFFASGFAALLYQVIWQRLGDVATREYFDRAGIDIRKMLATYLDAPTVYTPAYPRVQLADVNTDLFPKDEFDLSPR